MSDTFRPIELLLSCVLPLGALAASHPVARWLAVRTISLDRATRAALSFALALLWLQAGGMVLGFLHLLHAQEVIGWSALGLLGCVLFSQWRTRAKRPVESLDWRGLVLPAAVGTIITLTLLLEATVPPWFQDDMTYHLALPRLFAQTGGYAQPDDNIFAAFPLGWESILSMLHALGRAPEKFPPFNPRLLTVWTAVGAAFATGGLARQLGARPVHAAWSGVALLLVPTFAEFSTLCYVEAYLVLLSVLAMTLLLRAMDGELQLIAPAGVLAGAAASVKYPGLAVCAGLCLVLISGLWSQRERLGILLPRFVLAAIISGCPFYLRNIAQRGNAVFPLAFGWFGGRGWDGWRAAAYAQVLASYGAGRSAIDYILLPVRLLTAHDARSGFEASLGPAVIAGAVVAVLASRREWRDSVLPNPGRAASVALFAGFWFLFWAATTQQGRMFLVALPPLLALAGGAFSGPDLGSCTILPDKISMQYNAGTRIRAVIGGLVLTAALAWSLPSEAVRWSYQETTAWLTHRMDRDRLLSVMLPDTYPVERDIEKFVQPAERVWLVWMHNYTYYLRRGWRADQIFEDERFSRLLDQSATPADFAHLLNAAGFRHALVNEKFFLTDGSADRGTERTGRLREKFAACLKSRALVADYRRGDVVLYRVADSAAR